MAFTERGFSRGDDRTDASSKWLGTVQLAACDPVLTRCSPREISPGGKSESGETPERGRERILETENAKPTKRRKAKCLLLVNAAIIIRLTVSSQSLQALRHGLARQGTRLIRDGHAGPTVGRG